MPDRAAPAPISRWMDIAHTKDAEALDAWLDDSVVFHSPVMHSPQRGRAAVKMYLSAALDTLGHSDFRYVGQWCGADSAVLEFVSHIDGVEINGVDIIGWNAAGRVTSFKVMARPMKGIDKLREAMAARLAAMQQQQQ